jgi:hypothetical protein
MIQLIYHSQATEPFSQKQLTTLLTRARANNEALGITGMLIHHRGTFLQVLEGAEATVMRLLEIIAADPRHADVCELTRLKIAARNFGEWSMGFFNADTEALAETPGFADLFGRNFSRRRFTGDASIAAKLLLRFRDGKLPVAATPSGFQVAGPYAATPEVPAGVPAGQSFSAGHRD